MWDEKRLKEIAVFNPRETLKKGAVAKRIAMEQLQPFCRDVSAFDFAAFNGGTKFRNGDTIMARITPCLENGKMAKINVLDEDEVGFGSTEYIVLRAREEIDEDFLYYLIYSSYVREAAIKSMVGSSGRQRVQTSVLENLLIRVPPYREQQKIGRTLKDIDDKIASNRAINKNLEKQARAIFNSWFVDLLPFNRKIPSDWKILKFADIAELSVGGDKPAIVSETKSKECPYPIYSNAIAFNGLYGYTNIPRVKVESVTISARGTIGFVCLRDIPYVPIVRLITAIPKKHLVSAKYLYFWLKHIPIAGTGTTQQQLTIPAFKNTEILVPPIDIIIEFTDKVSHLFNLRYLYETEIEPLTSLRDTLLPRLMSGELDISNIEL